MTVAEVADFLVISPLTARTHVRHIHEKIGAHHVGQAIAWGLAHPELLSCDLPKRELFGTEVDSGDPLMPSRQRRAQLP